MNEAKQTSRLYDIAQDPMGALKLIDAQATGDSAFSSITGLWRSLGGTKLRRGRKPGDPKYRRSRSPKRTHAQRRRQRRGWQ